MISPWYKLGCACALAGATFHLAYATHSLGLVVAHLGLMLWIGLRHEPSGRVLFWTGLVLGLAMFAPQLGFLWGIFGISALALWSVLAFWIALFLVIVRACRIELGAVSAPLIAPVIWTGIEYFRCEVYPLRFSWLTPGAAMAWPEGIHAGHFRMGMYGVSFIVLLWLGATCSVWKISINKSSPVRVIRLFLILLAAFLTWELIGLSRIDPKHHRPSRVPVAGVQFEVPGPLELREALDRLAAANPSCRLFLLSEYTFGGPVPDYIRDWCRAHSVYLIAGGKEPGPGKDFRNTAYVVGPEGRTVFQQVKARPIQFFNDGLPAQDIRVWNSPWGKIGICICYDLNYTKVTDALVTQGAVALIVPTLDVVEWGAHQHSMHARMGPIRASEYQLPVIRLASSGISQIITREGQVTASAPYPGRGATLSGELEIWDSGRLPLDRWIAPACTWMTAFISAGLLVRRMLGLRGPRTSEASPPTADRGP